MDTIITIKIEIINIIRQRDKSGVTREENMKNNRMLKFLTLTFLISWTCWWGEALLVKTTGLTQVDIIPMIIFTIGGFGPTIAACFCLDEKFSLKALFRFVFRRERKTAGYLFLFLFLEIATFVYLQWN